jgi:14-3-3 protein epsilon
MAVDSEFAAGQIACKANRFQEGLRLMTESLKVNPRIGRVQRQILADCFHRAVSGPRNSLLLLNPEIDAVQKRGLVQMVERLRIVQKLFQDAIVNFSNQFLEIIDVLLLPVATDATSMIFYTKLKGDYYRYLVEVKPEDQGNVGRAKACYETAMRSITDAVKLSDPIYLGLVLNYCVFQYEILGLKDEAIERAETAFGEGSRGMDELDPAEYTEAAIVLQLFKDNLSIWKEERGGEVQLPQK